MSDLIAEIRQSCRLQPVQLPRNARHELHFAVRDGEDMPRIAGALARLECEPVLFFATDERTIEAGAYKVHLILSAPDRHIVFVEQSLPAAGHPTEYYSVARSIPVRPAVGAGDRRDVQADAVQPAAASHGPAGS